MKTILIVEDDPGIRRFLSVNLNKRDFRVWEAQDGDEALMMMREQMPDLAVVDLILPEVDGVSVCEWIRARSDMPIIVISAQDKEEEKVRALDVGADDFVTKPFGIEELLARIRAVDRRMTGAMQIEEPARIDLNGLEVDTKARRIYIDGEDTRLTRTEFALIIELARNHDRILNHNHLLMKVWGPEYRGSTHYLHVYLGRIRTKLKHYAHRLETISGVGYILHSEDQPHVTEVR